MGASSFPVGRHKRILVHGDIAELTSAELSELRTLAGVPADAHAEFDDEIRVAFREYLSAKVACQSLPSDIEVAKEMRRMLGVLERARHDLMPDLLEGKSVRSIDTAGRAVISAFAAEFRDLDESISTLAHLLSGWASETEREASLRRRPSNWRTRSAEYALLCDLGRAMRDQGIAVKPGRAEKRSTSFASACRALIRIARARASALAELRPEYADIQLGPASMAGLSDYSFISALREIVAEIEA